MVFKYENAFTYIIAACTFSFMVYIISNKFIPSIFVFIFISVVYLVLRRRRIIFGQNDIDVKSNLFKSKNFTALYTDLKEVKIDKIYSTTITDIVARFTFNVNNKTRRTTLSLHKYEEIHQLISLLKSKGVSIVFSDDYVNMIFNKDQK